MDMKDTIIGYTIGVHDLFRIGCLNLPKMAKGMCGKLIAGMTLDDLVVYQAKRTQIPFDVRIERGPCCVSEKDLA